MKIARMFRICTPDRTAPSGTLCVMQQESSKTTVLAISDDGTRTEHEFDEVLVAENDTQQPPRSIIGRTYVSDLEFHESRWKFYRELPVTGERVTQVVASMRVNPAVTAKG